MEKLLLGLLLAGDELDVVHQQQVRAPVFLPEFLGAARLDGVDQLVGEVVAFYIHDLVPGPAGVDALADGQQQMGLAKTGVAVDEQGVIHVSRILRHRQRRGVGVLVGGTHHEVVEGEAGHLGQRVVIGGLGQIAVQLLLARQHGDLELGGEQVAEHGRNIAGKALLDDVPLEVGGGVEHDAVVLQLHGRTVGKPGVQRRGGEVLPQHGQNAVPYVVEGIQVFFSPLFAGWDLWKTVVFN